MLRRPNIHTAFRRLRWVSIAALVCHCSLPGSLRAQAAQLTWDAPETCPDRDEVNALLVEQLGEHRRPTGEPLVAAGQVAEATSTRGFVLRLETPFGERWLESASCAALAQSAAVILAFLIDSAAPRPRAVPVVQAELNPSLRSEAVREVQAFVRIEPLVHAGLLPKVAFAPGLASGVIIARTVIEASGAYLPTQELRGADARKVGSLRAFIGRVEVCHDLIGGPALGPCLGAEYARVTGRGGSDLTRPRDISGGVVSLFAAARLSWEIGARCAWLLELELTVPAQKAVFHVGSGDSARVVYTTSGLLGSARAGFELRF
jgi:hypothetical protein